MCRCTIPKNQHQETGCIRGLLDGCINLLDDLMSSTSLTPAWVEVFVFFLDLCAAAFLRQSSFPSEETFSRLHGARHYVCYRTLASGIFSFRKLPETMIANEASEAKFLFSYLICSLEKSTVPQRMTTLAQNALRKLGPFLYFTKHPGICCI